MGDFRMALVSSVSVDLPNQHPSVVLRESESPRRQLTFSIAFHDAVVLSHALRRIPTPRPLTHELLTGILQRFDIDVVAVRLVGRQGSVYFAELDLMGRNGRSVQSCRPSDALTVALLQPVPVPILIDRRLFEQVGDVTPPGADRSPLGDALGRRPQRPANSRCRRSWLCSYCSWSAESTEAPPSSEMRMSRAMST